MISLSPVRISPGRILGDQLADAVLGEQLAAHGLQPGWFDVPAALRHANKQQLLAPLNPTHQRTLDPLLRSLLAGLEPPQ